MICSARNNMVCDIQGICKNSGCWIIRNPPRQISEPPPSTATLEETPSKSVAMAKPIPMILHCPAPGCGQRHIDCGEFATKPHHTHACQSCGFVWRPAIVPTVGVQFLPGFKD